MTYYNKSKNFNLNYVSNPNMHVDMTFLSCMHYQLCLPSSKFSKSYTKQYTYFHINLYKSI